MRPSPFAGSGVQKAWAQRTPPRHLRFVSTLTPFFADNCFAFLKVQFQTCYWVLLKTEHLVTGHRDLPSTKAMMAGLHRWALQGAAAPVKSRMSRSWRHRQVTEKAAAFSHLGLLLDFLFLSWHLWPPGEFALTSWPRIKVSDFVYR